MKKLLGLLASAFLVQASFAAVTTHPVVHTYQASIAEALAMSHSKKLTSDIGNLIVVINYDGPDAVTAQYSYNGTCDTALPPIVPRQSGIINIDAPTQNHVCLSVAGNMIWEGDVLPPGTILGVYNSGGYIVQPTQL